MSCIPFIVTNQGTVKIIERCGAFTGIAQPGCSFVIPCLDCVAGTVSMRLQQMEVACETKTKDNVFVSIKVAVQFQVKCDDESIKASHYRLTNARQQVGVLSEEGRQGEGGERRRPDTAGFERSRMSGWGGGGE